MDLAKTVVLDSKVCAAHVNYALFDNPKFGIQFFDATGKLPEGLLSGQIVSLGHYDQCLNISEMSPVGLIKGKYCLVKMLNVMSTFAGHGVCIPEACDYKLKLAQKVICQTKDSYSMLDSGDYWFLIVLGLIGFIMLLSTLYDIFTRKYELKQEPFHIIFSVLTNGEKLFDTQIAPDQISCLAGIRVLSIFWIIFGHRYFYLFYMPLKNSLDGIELLFSHWSFFVQTAFLAVDTFLFIGGFVLSYQCFKHRNKLSLTWQTIPYFYMHRLLRLLPLMTVIFFLPLTIFRKMGDGPLYAEIVENTKENCIKNWWSYFLFFQNYQYDNVIDQCLPHTWYLNVDFQLYLFTPLVIIPATNLLKDNKIMQTYYVLFGTLFLTTIISMFLLIAYDYRYHQTHTRISSYLIGIIMGLFIVENKDKTFKIGKKLYIFSWLLAIASMVYCSYHIHDVTMLSSPLVEAQFSTYMFITFGRPTWCLALSWIIFCCSTGNANILNDFLSNKFFLVVSRFNYSMYLLHTFVILLTLGTTRTTQYMSFIWMFHGSISDSVITILVSILFVLAFESPMIAFAKLLLSRREPQFSKTKLICKSTELDINNNQIFKYK